MAFTTPTTDDVINYSNDLLLDIKSPGAARILAEHHIILSNQQYRVSDDDRSDLEDSIEFIILTLLTESS